jgi:pimeloyl-ACP methyl ester carboxylesterase
MDRTTRQVAMILALSIATSGLACQRQPPGERRQSPASLVLTPHVFETADGLHRVEAEFGRLAVPEHRGVPNTRTISLAFVRLKGTGPTAGPPTIFVAGGPGIPTIAYARGALYGEYNKGSVFALLTTFREFGDVVIVDQRGTGLTEPNLDCPQALDLPLDRVVTREEMLQALRDGSRVCASFWKARGVDVAGYTTNENADDLDAIRLALGAKKMNLVGGSYASTLVLATIRRHAPNIGWAIMQGVEGTAQTIKLPLNTDRVLERIGQIARSDRRVSRLVPDFLGLVRSTLDRLERQPVTVQVPDKATGQTTSITVGRFDLELATAQELGAKPFINELPALYYAMSRNDFSWLGKTALQARRRWLGSAMAFFTDCASGVSKPRWATIQEQAPNSLFGTLPDFPFPEVCDGWGSPDLGAEFRSPIHSDVPVLFVSGTLDARTPVANVEEIISGFPAGKHLIVEHASHEIRDLLMGSPEISQLVLEFIRTGSISRTRATMPFAFEVPGKK